MENKGAWVLCLFTMICCFAFSCKKVKKVVNKGNAGMEINGQPWQSDNGYMTVIYDSILTFNFAKGKFVEGRFFSDETLLLLSIRKQMGRQAMFDIPFSNYRPEEMLAGKGFSLFGTYLQQGHEVCSQYMVYKDDSLNNWMHIEREEDDFKKIWGSFSMTMVTDTSYNWGGNCAKNPYSDTIRIRNATFYAEQEG